MSDRRSADRPYSADRRRFPRPPLWLNLVLLVIAAGTFVFAQYQRDTVQRKSAILFRKSTIANTPGEIAKIRDELSDMDLTEAKLAKELDSRLKYAESLKAEQFYIAVDTAKKKLFFRFQDNVVREMDVELGEAKELKGPNGKTWQFVPLRGAFTVTGKAVNYEWEVPEWVYVLNGQPIPSDRPTIPGGLGNYVIFLPNNYIIHSPPPAGSPLKGAKPGSFMVPEADLAAMWPRITTSTRVYVF